ncbi:hypothetical protein Tco_0610477 [Tanacetum coccineum]
MDTACRSFLVSTFFTQGKVSSIPIGGSISLEGFLSLYAIVVWCSVGIALAIDVACAFRAEEMPSLISCWMAAKVMAGVSDVDVLLGGILSTEDNTSKRDRFRFLGNSSSETKKYQGSNSNDGCNTRDGVKIAGGVIESGDEIEFSEELKELLPDEAGK